MRSASVLPLLLALTLAPVPNASATEIEGKWGLGIKVGDFVSSQAEASLIRGISHRTAWILDVAISQSKGNRDRAVHYFSAGLDSTTAPLDTTITSRSVTDGFAFNIGPRFRRFMRPESAFSPYWDLSAHFIDTSGRSSDLNSGSSVTRIGGAGGFALGAEYFSTRWPVSLAAHTEVVSVTWAHSTQEDHFTNPVSRETSRTVGNDLTTVLRLNPVLQIRVYF